MGNALLPSRLVRLPEVRALSSLLWVVFVELMVISFLTSDPTMPTSSSPDKILRKEGMKAPIYFWKDKELPGDYLLSNRYICTEYLLAKFYSGDEEDHQTEVQKPEKNWLMDDWETRALTIVRGLRFNKSLDYGEQVCENPIAQGKTGILRFDVVSLSSIFESYICSSLSFHRCSHWSNGIMERI